MDLKTLKRKYGTTPDEELAGELGVTVTALQAAAAQLALGKDKRVFGGRDMPRWEERDITLLCKLYPSQPNVAIGQVLGRSVRSVASKARALGLSKSPAYMTNMGSRNVALRKDRQKP